ncbi:hypothetical protein [Sorangium sp. So ce388]
MVFPTILAPLALMKVKNAEGTWVEEVDRKRLRQARYIAWGVMALSWSG